METKVSRWGNSIGVRVPAALAAEIGLEPGTLIRASIQGRGIHIEPVRPRPKYTLKQLLKGVTEANLHRETSAGPARGLEIVE